MSSPVDEVTADLRPHPHPPTAPGHEQLDVSVVIPCLDEELTIGLCVLRAWEAIRSTGLRGEVIVVDNGSADRSRILAEELSTWPKYRQHVDGDYVQLLYLTCPLHDIGKVAIPDAILLKPGKLTAEEFEVMKQHTVFGSDTLSSVAHARWMPRFRWA